MKSTEDSIMGLETSLEELVFALRQSAMELDQLSMYIEEQAHNPTETEEELENLYAKEFALAVNNSSLFEKIEKTSHKLLTLDKSNFKARRFEREAEKYLRVTLIDV